jgi:hypothetical protein
VKNR